MIRGESARARMIRGQRLGARNWARRQAPTAAAAARTRCRAACSHPGCPLHSPKQTPGELDATDFIESQKSGVREDLFKGSALGVDADVARGDFHSQRPAKSLAVRGQVFVSGKVLPLLAAAARR